MKQNEILERLKHIQEESRQWREFTQHNKGRRCWHLLQGISFEINRLIKELEGDEK